MVALVAGVPEDQVTVDREHQRAQVTAHALPGASLASYRALEARTSAAEDGWSIAVVPPLQPLPEVAFADNVDALDDEAGQSGGRDIGLGGASLERIRVLGVPGLPGWTRVGARPSLNQRQGIKRSPRCSLVTESATMSTAPPPGSDFGLVLATGANGE